MTSWRSRARRAAAPSARPSHASSRLSQRSARRTTSSTSCRRCAAARSPSPAARPRRACRGASALARRPTGRRPLPPPPAAPQIQELSRQLEAERTRIKLESGGEAGGRLIVVANRLPVTPVKNANGEWELKRSSGGLVSAFLGEPAPRSGSGIVGGRRACAELSGPSVLGVRDFSITWVGWVGVEARQRTAANTQLPAHSCTARQHCGHSSLMANCCCHRYRSATDAATANTSKKRTPPRHAHDTPTTRQRHAPIAGVISADLG